MALAAILAPAGNSGVISMNRGNVGVLTGVVAKSLNYLSLPTLGAACDYPSENDVRDGISFADTLTGNLELPAESDVLTGVPYGSNGTELEGTATGGVGTFISIVNE